MWRYLARKSCLTALEYGNDAGRVSCGGPSFSKPGVHCSTLARESTTNVGKKKKRWPQRIVSQPAQPRASAMTNECGHRRQTLNVEDVVSCDSNDERKRSPVGPEDPPTKPAVCESPQFDDCKRDDTQFLLD